MQCQDDDFIELLIPNQIGLRKLFSLGPKLNTKISFHTTTTTHHKELLDQQYLSCYWPDFDETLKVGSWEHLEQIPIVRLTFAHVEYLSC